MRNVGVLTGIAVARAHKAPTLRLGMFLRIDGFRVAAPILRSNLSPASRRIQGR